jgi:hypothetical protein
LDQPREAGDEVVAVVDAHFYAIALIAQPSVPVFVHVADIDVAVVSDCPGSIGDSLRVLCRVGLDIAHGCANAGDQCVATDCGEARSFVHSVVQHKPTIDGNTEVDDGQQEEEHQWRHKGELDQRLADLGVIPGAWPPHVFLPK